MHMISVGRADVVILRREQALQRDDYIARPTAIMRMRSAQVLSLFLNALVPCAGCVDGRHSPFAAGRLHLFDI